VPKEATWLPTIYFNRFPGGGVPGSFEAERATGTFDLEGKEVSIEVAIPYELGIDDGPKAYRVVIEKVRDRLTEILNNPGGVQV
jgi:hypothetical protein